MGIFSSKQDKIFKKQIADLEQKVKLLQSTNSTQGIQGPQGPQGIPGKDGQPGRDGRDGKDGSGIGVAAKGYGLNVQDFGVVPSNTAEQNGQAIKALIEAQPISSGALIYFPKGEYHFSETINLYRRPLHLLGDNGSVWAEGSTLRFPAGVQGINIDRGGQSIQGTIIEKLCLIGGKTGSGHFPGIGSNARLKCVGVTVKGFEGNGFYIWANMTGESNDASGSSYEGCHALENAHDGYFAGREDANAITYVNCDARDNARFGFNDDSFLGNNYIGCMAHYNAKGDYHVRDWGNARSLFAGCYSEGNGEVFSQFSARTTVVGGTWGAGFKIENGALMRASYIDGLTKWQ